MNVSQVSEVSKEKITKVSARLKIFLMARLLNRRRVGQTAAIQLAMRTF
jgi:hypothetical protein